MSDVDLNAERDRLWETSNHLEKRYLPIFLGVSPIWILTFHILYSIFPHIEGGVLFLLFKGSLEHC